MKRLLFIATAFVAFSLTSCLSDDEPVRYFGELGTISGETVNDFVINTDGDNTLKPYGMMPSYFKFKDGKRVLVQYSVVTGVDSTRKYTVEVASIQDLFQKDLLIVDDVSRDTLKNDPINMSGAWIGKDFLNIEFSFRGSGRKEFPHYIDLVLDSTKQDKADHIALDLTHNSNEDGLYDIYKVLMSVSLEDLQVTGQDSVQIWLRTNDQMYDPKSIVYRYNQAD